MLLRIALCLKAVLQCVDLICSRSGLLDIATKLCRCSGDLRIRRIVKLQADPCGGLRRRNVRGALAAVTKYCPRIRDAIAEEGAIADYGVAAWFQQHV